MSDPTKAGSAPGQTDQGALWDDAFAEAQQEQQPAPEENPFAAPLNPPQQKAVLHTEGPLLIFAGAGSGKTRTITFRIANLVATHRVPPYRILAVTFTNKAASEMRERIEGIAGEEIASDLWIGTFHGTCAKLLRRYHEEVGLSQGFVIYDDSDQKAVVNRLIKQHRLDDRAYPPKAVLAQISAAKREGHDPSEHDLNDGFDANLVMLGREYQKALRRSNAVDFDDLLLYVLRIVENPDSPAGRDLRSRFNHVLVDEFQDTNWVQYRIVRALTAESRNLCVVGDDDQSIYRWRGADVRIIRGFRKDFSETLVVKLEQNYRSTKNIVSAALGVIEPCATREPKELWTAEDPGEKVVVRSCENERNEAAFVASGIGRARARGTAPNELAVFYRIHAMSRVLEEALRGEGVPYQIIGGTKFFERAEVKDMLSYLRLVENSDSDMDFLRVVNVPTRGIGKKTVDTLNSLAAESALSLSRALDSALNDKTLTGAPAKKLGRFFELMNDLRTAKDRLTPGDLMERILEETGYRKLLEKDDSAESDARLENIAELVGSIREYEAEAPESGEEATITGYLERVALVSPADAMDGSPKVSLMTVHAAKGLEFDSVWITGMEEETFPYRGLDGRDPEELDEERRLAYVAITRARRHLSITHAGSRFLFGRTKYLAPSRFIGDLPDEVTKHEGAPRSAAGAGRSAFTEGYGQSRGFGGGGYGGGRRSPKREVDELDQRPQGPVTLGGKSERKPPPLLKPGQRTVDRDVFDDIPQDEVVDEQFADQEAIVVRPGQLVRHKKFGRGVVERIESGDKPKITARFPGYGPKTLLAQFLEFE